MGQQITETQINTTTTATLQTLNFNNASTSFFRLPALATASRTGLTGVSAGYLIYDTGVNDIYFHNGTAWSLLNAGTLGGQAGSYYLNPANLSSAVAVNKGGTGQTSFTANQIIYGNGTNALSTSSNLTFNGTQLTISGNRAVTIDEVPYLGTASIIRTNSSTLSASVTIPAGTNGMSAGPITIASGQTVTVNGDWSIV